MATYDAIDIVGPFTIQELSGDLRLLTLTDRALPYKPYTLEGEHRVEVTWYPGNPVGTAQVLGAKETTSTVGGFWKDRFISDRTGSTPPASVNGVTLGSAQVLADLVDDIRRKGQLVEVTWQHLTRRGFITKFRQTWHTLRDVEWEIDFTWIAHRQDRDVGALVQPADLRQSSIDLSAEAMQMLDVATDPVFGLVSIRVGLGASLLVISSSSAALVDSARASSEGYSRSTSSSRRAVSAMESMVAEARQVNLLLEAQTYPALASPVSNTTGQPDYTNTTLGAAVASAYSRQQITSANRSMKHKTAREQARMLRSLDPNLVRVFYAREDQDLRDVSLFFFGTADQWRNIAQFNQFDSSRLRSNQVVLVPHTFTDEKVT